MPTFAYTAIDASSGRERKGTLESVSSEQASADLKARGLAPTSLAVAVRGAAKVTPREFGPRTPAAPVSPDQGRSWDAVLPQRRVSRKTIALFTRQLARLVRAGMPLVRSLEVLARQERGARFHAVLVDLAGTIRSGGSFSDGLAHHPAVFDRLYINMVKAGETGGVLGTVLERLARFTEMAERTKAKVKSAMTYPVIVVLLAAGIVSALMVFVVPRFEQIFSGLLKGQPLPALTRVVLSASYFVKHHIVLCLMIATAAWITLAWIRRTAMGTRLLDRLAIRLPVFGDLMLKAAIARFARTFGTLLASGVPILQALTITRDTSGNVHVADAIDVVHDRVKAGDGVARPLEATGLFPGMVTSMIAVGEETGSLAEMLSGVADTYDEEVDNAVASLTSLIEPLMIVFLAFMVGTIVIALFLPIVAIIQHLQ